MTLRLMFIVAAVVLLPLLGLSPAYALALGLLWATYAVLTGGRGEAEPDRRDPTSARNALADAPDAPEPEPSSPSAAPDLGPERWTVVCNMTREPRGGPTPDKIIWGTNTFAPGVRLFAGDAYNNSERTHVVGLGRDSRRLVNGIVPMDALVDARPKLVDGPAELKSLEQLRCRFFADRREAQDHADYLTYARLRKQGLPEAEARWSPAAERGEAEAQFRLGLAYDNGEGVGMDDVAAAVWYRKAAAQGHAIAQNNLGRLYASGDGVAEDAFEAAAWYRAAAEQGYAIAQVNLGLEYVKGRGVVRDASLAAEWFRLAAEQGDAGGQFLLGVRYALGDGVGIDKARAAELYRAAAEQGHASAQFNLALMLKTGDGVPKDEARAAVWRADSAAHGNPVIKQRLKEWDEAWGDS